MRTRASLSLLAVTMLLAGACTAPADEGIAEDVAPVDGTARSPEPGGADDLADDQPSAADDPADAADDPAAAGGPPTDDDAPDADDPPADHTTATADASMLELRDGVWPVGDAGEIEFRVVDDDTLELVDVRPAPGWTVTEQEISPDEIDVDFARDHVEWEIEVEIERGILEIEIDQDIDPAEPGTYTVGLAGTVEIALGDDGLHLVDVVPEPGWDVRVEEETPTDIDVELRQGPVVWEFDADLDDGVISIEIDFEIEGPFPR